MTPVREPAPPLKAVLDIPIRFPDAAPELLESVGELAKRSREGEPDWPAIYESATEIVTRLVEGMDGQVEDLQRRLLDLDPNELRQRLTAAPRREVERKKADAAAALSAVEREWMDRAARQADYVVESCVAHAKGALQLEERSAQTGGIALAVDGPAWAQFTGYVSRCCDQWCESARKGIDEDAARALASAAAALGGASRRPDDSGAPPSEGQLGSEPPVKNADVPSTMGALLSYVRSNIMTVGIFGTVIAVVIALVGRFTGEASSSMSGGSMLMRGGLVIAVLPLVLAAGIVAARKQRERLRARAIEDYEKAVQAFVKAEVERAAQKQRKAVERWVKARVAAWSGALDALWQDTVEPRLRGDDDRAQKALVDARLEHQKLQDQLQRLRTLRSQASGNLLVDLRRRLAELRAG